MRILFVFLFGILYACSSMEQKQAYPAIVLEKKLTKEYDRAKYLFYLFHANKFCTQDESDQMVESSFFLSHYPVQTDNISVTDSTMVISLAFVLENNQLCMFAEHVATVHQYWTVYLGSRRDISVASGNWRYSLWLDFDRLNQVHYYKGTALNSSLQDSILHQKEKESFTFLSKNKHQLNDWFLQQLKERKVLE